MSRRLALLVVIAGLVFFAGLGRGAVGDADEAFYAEASREMVASGDWLTPYYNFETRFQKPILYYWLASTVFTVVGPGALAARIPAACSGLVLVFVTYRMARRRGTETAWVAGLIAATNFGYAAIGRMALPDLPLAACMTLATWAAFESIDAGRAGRRGGARTHLVIAAAAAALAMLMKGPVGVALPVLIVAPSLAGIPRLGQAAAPRSPWPWRASDLLVALAAFVVIAAPWYIAMAQEHGLAYWYRFFVGENLDRFATDRYNEPRSPLFYVPIVLGGLMPWTPFAGGALVPFGTLRSRLVAGLRLDARLVVWALVPLAFYSLSIGKQPRYVLPVLPPVAVLLASVIVRALAERRRAPVAAASLATAALYLALAAFVWRAQPLLVTLDAPSAVVVVAALSLAALAVVLSGTHGRLDRVPLAFASAAAVVLLTVNAAVYSAEGDEPVERLAEAVARHVGPDTPLGTHKVFVRNLVFYTGRRTIDLSTRESVGDFLASATPVACVLREADRDALEPGLRSRLTTHAALTYFNPSAVRLKTLLRPDPERELERIVLVSTRPVMP